MPAFDGLASTISDPARGAARRATELAQVPGPQQPFDWAALEELLNATPTVLPPGRDQTTPLREGSSRGDTPSEPNAPLDRGSTPPADLPQSSGSARFDSHFATGSLDPTYGDPFGAYFARSSDFAGGAPPSIVLVDRNDSLDQRFAPPTFFILNGPPPGPPPNITVATASGSEDTTIPLTLTASVSEARDSLSLTISGVPSGASLSVGTDLGGGVWAIDPDDLASLAFIPRANSDADVTLVVTATETTPEGLIGTRSANLVVVVDAVVDTPSISASAAAGGEDSFITLPIIATLGDTDGSETMTLTVSGVPTGATLSAGTHLGGGVWTVAGAQISGLAIRPPSGSEADFTLSLTATATDTGGSTATAATTLAVTVNAVADAPVITVSPASGGEDQAIALAITVALGDTDGSETLGNVTISGVPAGATLSAGTDLGGGVWSLTTGQLSGLTITPPANSDADFTLTVSATATESSTSATATGTANLAVTVAGAADTPSVSTSPASGNEDQPIALSISAGLADTDGSETLAITISNVPTGATLSAGTNLGGGIWRLTAAQLSGLTITPPANSDADFTLTVTATATDGSSTANASTTLAVSVAAAADAPTLAVSPASGSEDSAIALSITSALADSDGSETLAITIAGVPSGAALSAGTDLGGGTWSLTAAQLSGLTITPPANSDADFTLTVTATATDTGGAQATTSASLAVSVAAVADAPTLSTAAASGNEDSAIALSITTALTDPSETLSIAIAGVPTGASLSAGTNLGGGIWSLTAGQLSGLTITPPANRDTDFTLTVTATATDGASTASTVATLAVTVNPVADTPGLSVSDATGTEDTAIALTIAASLGDVDGSESLAIVISNVPAGATLSAGSDLGGGAWSLTAAQLAGLTLTPPANDAGDFTLTVTATATDGASTATASQTLDVTVDSAPDAPTLSVGAASGSEDSAIALAITAALTDAAETLSISIAGVPSGATLSAGTDEGGGVWTLTPGQLSGLTITPPANSDADFTLTVAAISTDAGSGTTASTQATLAVTVAGVADQPTLSASAASGGEDSAISLSIASALADADGSETLAITVSGVPTGAALSAGTNQGGGVWTLTPAQLSGLAITPPANSDADFTLTVTATATEGAGGTATNSTTLAVTVNPVADAPVLAVSPASGSEDAAIALNISSSLSDGDGSETLAISISGVPTGATLSAGTDQGGGVWTLTSGQLAGLTVTPPANSDADFTLTVTATASDGASTASTSADLAVTVAAVADTPSLSVSPASGNEDAAIALSITAGLADPSETLAISIAGVPSGATLSAGTDQGGGVWTLTAGQLSGLTITAPANSDGDFTLTVTATSTDGGVSASTSADLAVTVAAVADAPNLSVSPASGEEDTAIALSISGSLADSDGSESLSYAISGVPSGAVLSAGTDQGGGVWTLTAAQLAGLTITPPANDAADFTLTVTATATDAGGSTATSSANLAVTVVGSADAPTLSVSPASGTEDGGAIALTISAALTDLAETLSLTISGVPAGVVLSAGTDQGGGVWSLAPGDLAGLTLTPVAGSDADFTLVVAATSTDTSGGDTATTSANLAVTINAVADTPTLTLTGTASGNEDTAIALTIGGSLADTDGSETLTFRISGVPAGATLSSGSNQGGGVWLLTAAQASGVTLTPPANSDADFTLTVRAIATEGAGGTANSADQTIAITVAPVVDAPSLTVQDAVGLQDTAFALDIDAALVDTDGSESIAITIAGVPSGATLSAGTDQGGGTWSLTAAQLAGLTITPPSGDAGDFTLTVTATSTETGGATATTSHSLDVIVVQDPLTLVTPAASGNEDSAIALNIAAIVADPTDTVSVTIEGVPAGATLSAGTDQGGGTWVLTAAQLSGLTITPAADTDADFSLTVTATATHQAGGSLVESGTLAVTVNPVADAPTLSLVNSSGDADTAIPLTISGALNDLDGSETLSFRFANVPAGAAFSAGTDLGGGVWSMTEADLTGLTITPPSGSVLDFTLSVSAVATDGASQTLTTRDLIVAVTGGADPPSLAVNDAAGNEDSPIALDIVASLVDPDETLSILISSVPAGATLSNGVNQGGGTWLLSPIDLSGLTITPAPGSDDDLSLLIEASSYDPLTGDTARISATLDVTVDAVADAPTLTVSDASGDESTAIALSIGAVLNDNDGSESLSYLIDDVPSGATLSAGTDNGDGSWTLAPVDLSGLTITPAAGDASDFTLSVTATATDHGGVTASSTSSLIVTVNDTP
ncbi:MAG: hypothetical protein JNL66_20975 [Alphaproteobacteria bacterium]|nr:hypothetical protein [Alphaproteobacteria bacterium]